MTGIILCCLVQFEFQKILQLQLFKIKNKNLESMFSYFILFFSTVTAQSSSFHFDSSFSLSNKTNPNTQLPQNYTLQGTYETSVRPGILTYSPNENWIVYSTNQNNSRDIIFFRKRNEYGISSERRVKIGNNSQLKININQLAFSQSGDLLFVGTYVNNTKSYLFVCRFSVRMRDEDCIKNMSLFNDTTSLWEMRTNSANKIAIGGYDYWLWVLNFNSEGDLKFELQIRFQNSGCYIKPMWHPAAQKDTLVISRINWLRGDGGIIVYNITSKANNTLINEGFGYTGLIILKDNQTLLASFYNYSSQEDYLTQYYLSKTNLTQIGTIYKSTNRLNIDSASVNGNLVAGINCTVVCVNPPNSVGQINANNHPSTSLINLKQLYSFKYEQSGIYSADLNELLLRSDNSTLQRYSLCINSTFLSNMQCLNCFSLCTACHLSPDLCFSCSDRSFLDNNSCLECKSVQIGCMSCSNSSYCLNCQDNTYALINGSCRKCDTVLTGCQQCLNSSNCSKCENQNYILINGLCVKCFVLGCAQCFVDNICVSCYPGLNLQDDGQCRDKTISIYLILLFIAVGLVVVLAAYCIIRKLKKKRQNNFSDVESAQKRQQQSSVLLDAEDAQKISMKKLISG